MNKRFVSLGGRTGDVHGEVVRDVETELMKSRIWLTLSPDSQCLQYDNENTDISLFTAPRFESNTSFQSDLCLHICGHL